MPAPKGMRTKSFKLNETDAIFVYTEPRSIWLQLRRDHPTKKNIGISSFKSALKLTREEALELAAELLTVAAQQPLTANQNSNSTYTPSNHGVPWNEKEEKQLLSRHSSGMQLEDIAKKHKRGLGGIRARLIKLGRISPESLAPFGAENLS